MQVLSTYRLEMAAEERVRIVQWLQHESRTGPGHQLGRKREARLTSGGSWALGTG